MHLRLPFARAGLSKLEASNVPPLADPAPIIVWISSINKIEFFCSAKSFNTSFSLCSKSPLYFVPAIKAPKSSEYITLPSSTSGISFSTIFFANPSAIAVLPTPASPTKRGLFFRLLQRI